jgi:hypothetical protein
MPKAMGMEVEREAGSVKSSLKDLAHPAGIEQLPVLVAKDPRRHLRPLAPESLRLPLELKSFQGASKLLRHVDSSAVPSFRRLNLPI